MYERFTDRARKVMQLANQEAQRFNHAYIGTEHVLLGLVAEGSGVAANVLRNLNIDLSKIRREIELIVQHGQSGEQVILGRLPHTPRTKKVIEYSIDEARGLNHNYVGTEHLLLGLLREEEGLAAQVLMNLGLKLEDVRAEVMSLLGQTTPLTGKADVFHIAKSLKPEKAETYPVSEPKPLPLSDTHLQILRNLLEKRNTEKEECIQKQDFEGAVRYRDEADALRRILAWYEWSHRRQ
jgi:ATP-dependent Clp protease ATP-binding subunit ClpA